jgi:hypothetical protein
MFRRLCYVIGFTAASLPCLVTAQVQIQEFSGGGKLLGFAPGAMVYVTAQGQRQEVKFAKPGEMSVTLKPAKGPPQPVVAGPPTIDITGEMAADQIRPGFTVVIHCLLDAKGATTKPVEAIKVLDVRPDVPGINNDGSLQGDAQPVLIKGTAKSYKNGTLTIAVPKHNFAPKGTIALEIAESAKVTFESHNPAMAPVGAIVDVKGLQYGPGGEVAVREIKVTLAAPAAKKPAKKRPAKPAAPGAKPEKNPDASGDAPPKEDAPADEKAQPPSGRKKRSTPGKIVPLG